MIKLNTKNTWCPGCGNFGIERALGEAVEKIGVEKTVLVSGIGCHGKIVDYMNMNTFCALHGRAIASAEGVKVGDSSLNVICCVGDGDTYCEGVEHFIHAAKRNANITVLVHDNRNFALTARQFTATTPRGFKGGSTPRGSTERPFNPMELALVSGASFIARGYSSKTEHLTDLILKGVNHRGFSFIEVLQPCVAWFNTLSLYNEKVYEVEGPFSKEETKKVIGEWDYENDSPIAIGLFYKEERPVFEDTIKRDTVNIEEILKSKI